MTTRKFYAAAALCAGLLAILLLIATVGTGSPPEAYGRSLPGRALPANAQPITPPDATQIAIGPANSSGVAQVTGASGAVPANAAVAIVNLSARSVITATADSGGGFSAALFAPPGSTLLVKYSPDPQPIELLWEHAFNPGGDFNYMNALPGTTLYVPGSPPTGLGTPFHAAGYFGAQTESSWAGWWIEGVAAAGLQSDTLRFQPGDVVTVSGRFSATSPALGCSNPNLFAPRLHFHTRSMFADDGFAQRGETWFNAYLFTPTGLPIELEGPPGSRALDTSFVTNLQCVSADTLTGGYAVTLTLPLDLATGTHLLRAFVDMPGIPLAASLPIVTVWYHGGAVASLPPLTIGSPDSPRIPWTLLTDYPVNGQQGITSLEDGGRYQLVNRTIFPPHRTSIPMLDPRSGAPLTYRLEPGSNWLSATDRRFPNPPPLPLLLPGGELQVEILKPNGASETIGPWPIKQSSVRMPTLPDGTLPHSGTGHFSDVFTLYTGATPFAYQFDQYGPHTILLNGYVEDIYGNGYPLATTYEVVVARTLDLDPAQLPTMPFEVGGAFSAGLHVYPPLPAEVEIRVRHLPNSDPAAAIDTVFSGRANRFGYYQPPPGAAFLFESPGEYRVDLSAEYEAPDGTFWAGYMTWGNVVAAVSPGIEAHGRRGMDYHDNRVDDMPDWFRNANLPAAKVGIENYYPYYSGDIHWGTKEADGAFGGDSIHSIVTFRDLSGPTELFYDLLRAHYPRATNAFRWPPDDITLTGLNARLAIHEAPLFMTTTTGEDPALNPEEIDLWGYWYGSSARPDVRVREIISEDNMGTAYWRFADTYGFQIGEPANGDQTGDLKWEFGGIVLRAPYAAVQEYAIYSSLWVLLPAGCDAYGCARVTPPFQSATGAGINGGPIMVLDGEEIDLFFLPKGIRPGDVLELGDTVAFSGQLGPPLNSDVDVVITAPSGATYGRAWRANRIGWLYDPTFDFVANETGRWTVDVHVEHNAPYIGNGVVPLSHNSGSVLGSGGQYSFYVVAPDVPRLALSAPHPGFLPPPQGDIPPVTIRGLVPPGTTVVHYTVHDKGVVMDQGAIVPDAQGWFTFLYDPVLLQARFPMLSLTAHDGVRPGLADEVAINFLATGAAARANTVTLLGEEIFVESGLDSIVLPVVVRR